MTKVNFVHNDERGGKEQYDENIKGFVLAILHMN